jgi:hypothetical protein
MYCHKLSYYTWRVLLLTGYIEHLQIVTMSGYSTRANLRSL